MTIEMFEKPLGMRDDFPLIAKQKADLKKQGTHLIEHGGYELLQTPTLEYYETIGKISAISDDALFKLLDNQGKTLVLRPDMTSPIARVAASKLLREKMPIRLGYYSNVFRAQKREGGRPAEFEQMGVELIGDDSLYADAEVISLAWDILKELGVGSARTVIGHTRLLELILADFGLDAEQSGKVRELFVAKNGVGVEQLAKKLPIPENKLASFLKLMQATTVADWKRWINEENEEQRELYHDMERLEGLLGRNGLGDAITFDISFSSHMTYYTGLVFEFYGAGSGFPLGSGGRYDGLMEQFGLQVGATGFGLRVDRLLESVTAEKTEQPHTLILFDEQSEQNAFDKAQQIRNSGKRVTLQYAPAVKALEPFTALFTEVITGEELHNG
ncbi:ATP phosphoribosyltransferase regulatory subunit [Planococcus sp. CP5-4]|uniref:ATP phosphoribosyltransferase regulatory subunit n=1 Tax=unclassified Planococcus (in: firmicutes) TaxID=2662419 RepID=UPI001C23A591|nr:MULTISPECIES: ATP phosphoribosyltransferase regulatory subunit [unclassified Planococcus (in: firmicutes)]MBU9674177.1 ATP phosphoribosyltransferase regulatory subunit [Planococcus sp. CP5-4_YE]MBV0910004.1 ATP phosphoribosyltransferase regulatory subunit [Planococcus sp. CP5-4_UN]MBW6064538.1 ATP phosphoribosyltransferase regulatory subunit [Planococcus sp. CP5-4]